MQKMILFATITIILMCILQTSPGKAFDSQNIELRFRTNEIMNPGVKNDIRLHFINNTKDNIRIPFFFSGAVATIIIVDSTGRPVERRKDSTYRQESGFRTRNSFVILPGDCSGVIFKLNDYFVITPGLFYLIFAIQDPENKGVLFSPPEKLLIGSNGMLDSYETISIRDLSPIIRNSFQKEFKTRLANERISSEFTKLPF